MYISHVYLRTALDEQLHALHMTASTREVGSSGAVLVRQVRICAAVEQ
jgi:hypothetical protein